jgi:hypothetical protein
MVRDEAEGKVAKRGMALLSSASRCTPLGVLRMVILTPK